MNLREAYHDPLQPAVPSGRIPLDVYQVEEGARKRVQLDTSLRGAYLHTQRVNYRGLGPKSGQALKSFISTFRRFQGHTVKLDRWRVS